MRGRSDDLACDQRCLRANAPPSRVLCCRSSVVDEPDCKLRAETYSLQSRGIESAARAARRLLNAVQHAVDHRCDEWAAGERRIGYADDCDRPESAEPRGPDTVTRRKLHLRSRVRATGEERFNYNVNNGTGFCWNSVTIQIGNGPTTLGPPTGLSATVTGNTVALSWAPPLGGLTPTGYSVEGGVAPGDVLAAVPVGGTATSFAFAAPSGSFYLRLHALAGGQRSAASNEIRVFVNVPQPPAAPTSLLGAANGSMLSLGWKNSATGGAIASMTLLVGGSLSAALPIPAAESFTFPSVPSGTYTFAVVAGNAAGSSAASSPVTLSFPGSCSGIAGTPTAFAASRAGNTISLTWEPPSSGAPAVSYLVEVGGAFVGVLPVNTRSIAGQVASGTYTLRVYSESACGRSAPTATATIAVP